MLQKKYKSKQEKRAESESAPLTSCSSPRRFSSVKDAVWLFTPIFRGSTRLLESQLTEPPWRRSSRELHRQRRTSSLLAARPVWKSSLTSVFTLVRYRSWFPPFVVVGRAMVRYRRLTGKLPVEIFHTGTFFITYFFQTDGRRRFIARVVEMYHTLTVKLNCGPMSSRVLTAVMTGVAALTSNTLLFDSLWIRKQGRTYVSRES